MRAGGEDLLGEGEFLNEETLSDGTAGGIEARNTRRPEPPALLPSLPHATGRPAVCQAGAVTYPICKSLVDDWVSVSEDEIGDGGATRNPHPATKLEPYQPFGQAPL